MKTLFIKYRHLSTFVGAAYLGFSLVLPVFHHHHEEENSHSETHEYHSHLLSGIHEHDKETHTDFHSLEDINNHTHFVNLNLVDNGKVKRILISQITPISISFSANEETKSYSNKLIKTEPEDKQRRERYVRSAANVSPPLS